MSGDTGSLQYLFTPVSLIIQSLLPGKSIVLSSKVTSFISIKGNGLDNVKYLLNLIGERLHINQLGLIQLESELVYELDLTKLNKLGITYESIDIALQDIPSFPKNVDRMEITDSRIKLWM